jgi:hypothetical protein
MTHVHTWIAYKHDFGRYVETNSTEGQTPAGAAEFEVTHEWEICSMADAEGMTISVLFCPDCKETMELDPPEPFVTTHPYNAG